MTENVAPRPQNFLCAERSSMCQEPVGQDGDYCPEHDFHEPDLDAARKDRLLDERGT